MGEENSKEWGQGKAGPKGEAVIGEPFPALAEEQAGKRGGAAEAEDKKNEK